MGSLRYVLLWFAVLLLMGSVSQPAPTSEFDTLPIIPAQDITLEQFMDAAETDYLSQVSFTPQEAQFFDLVNGALNLTPEELALMEQNGFVVSDRLAFQDFVHAYAWIYWQDLPVFISSDSLLHAVHETYSDMLMQIEAQMISPMLDNLLEQTRQELYVSADCSGDMQSICEDLDVYLDVALGLLNGSGISTLPRAQAYLDMVYGRQTASTDGIPVEAVTGATPNVQATATALAQLQMQPTPTAGPRIAGITLFGGEERAIDFTQFTPRGHYTESQVLSNYFRAMTWLALLDFRFVDYDPFGNPTLNPTHIAAAALLRDTLDSAGMHPVWQQMDALFGALFGRSDNTTLPELDQFLTDAGINAPIDALIVDPSTLLNLLTTNDYGQQRITGQIQTAQQADHEPLARPVSFMLLGKRFTLDSYVMSNLVYDRLVVDGSNVRRPFPSPLDVMYVLGNDRAATHLESELTEYGYQGNLAAERAVVDNFASEYWSSTSYNLWLGMIRTLSSQTTAENYPQAMRTAAWADRTLQTQLGSWTQLRHDTLLYVEQSYTMQILCQYPAGYVDPYPEFYAALADYARAGRTLMQQLDTAMLSPDAQTLRGTALGYFDLLESVATRLQTIAEKELRLEQFTMEEEQFIRNTVVRQDVLFGYGQMTETWTGWYASLFPWEDDSPALVADVHTNTAVLIPPAGVLHVATGSVVANIMIADTDEGPTIYVGPSFTYYEFIEESYPPVRLNNEVWRVRLYGDNPPTAPAWTSSFRLPTSINTQFLMLPQQQEGMYDDIQP